VKDEVFIVGKHHPRNLVPPQVFRQVVGDMGVWIDDVPLGECLSQVDRVAAVNSTVLFEALMHRKPVLTLGQSILRGKGIAHEITCLEDGACRRLLRDWLAGDGAEERFSRWVDLGASLLSDCLFLMAPPAGERYLGAACLAERLIGKAGGGAEVGSLRVPGFRLFRSMAEDGELKLAMERMLGNEIRTRLRDSEWLAENVGLASGARAFARRLRMKMAAWFRFRR